MKKFNFTFYSLAVVLFAVAIFLPVHDIHAISFGGSYSGYSYVTCSPTLGSGSDGSIVGNAQHTGEASVSASGPVSAQVNITLENDASPQFTEAYGIQADTRVYQAGSTFDEAFVLIGGFYSTRVSTYPNNLTDILNNYCGGTAWTFSANLNPRAMIATIGSASESWLSVGGGGAYSFPALTGTPLSTLFQSSTYSTGMNATVASASFGPNPRAITSITSNGNNIQSVNVPSGGADNTVQTPLHPISVIVNKNTGARVAGPFVNSGCGVIEYYKESVSGGSGAYSQTSSNIGNVKTPTSETPSTITESITSGPIPDPIRGRSLVLDSVPTALSGIVTTTNWESVSRGSLSELNAAKLVYNDPNTYEVRTYSVVEGTPPPFVAPASEASYESALYDFASKVYGTLTSCVDTLTPDPTPLTCTVSPSSPNVETGESVTWSVTPFNVSGPYTYSWSGSSSLTGSESTAVKTYYTPTSQHAIATITANAGASRAQCSGTVNVDPVLTATCSANPSPATIQQGQTGTTVQWSAVPSGGTGSYTYSWSGAVSGTDQTRSVIYTTPGTKNASVTITSGSDSVVANCSTNVVGGFEYDLSLSPSSVTMNQTDSTVVNVATNWLSGSAGPVGVTHTILDSEPSVPKPYNIGVSFGTVTCTPTCTRPVTITTNNTHLGNGYAYRIRFDGNIQTDSGTYPTNYLTLNIVEDDVVIPYTPSASASTGACGAQIELEFHNYAGESNGVLVDGYRIKRNTVNDYSTAIEIDEFAVGAVQPGLTWAPYYQQGEYIDSGLSNEGTTYYYFVESYIDNAGVKTYSNSPAYADARSSYFCITGTPSCSASPNPVYTGSQVEYQGSVGTVTGGQAPYSFRYRFSDYTTGYLPVSTINSFVRTYLTQGLQNAYIQIRSADGQMSPESASCPVTVNQGAAQVSLKIKPKLASDGAYIEADNAGERLVVAYDSANGGNNDNNQVTLEWVASGVSVCHPITGAGYENWDTYGNITGNYTTSGIQAPNANKLFGVECRPTDTSLPWITNYAHLFINGGGGGLTDVTCVVRPSSGGEWRDSGTVEVRLGERVDWQVTPSPVDDGSYSYLWTGSTPLNGATTPVVSVLYNTTGTKTGVARVTDGGGNFDECTNNVRVIVLPPKPNVEEF